MTQSFTLTVNDMSHRIDADPDMPLLYALRDDLGLNNPHFGCGLAQCGACTVHLDGQAIRSCVTPLSAVGNGKITTLADRADPDAPRMLWDNSNIIESYSGVTTPLTFSFARHAYQHVYGEFCRLMRISAAEIEANKAAGEVTAVRVAGECVMVSRGEIDVP